eukprot:3984721-Prorocentrum_lima.AAC.1
MEVVCGVMQWLEDILQLLLDFRLQGPLACSVLSILSNQQPCEERLLQGVVHYRRLQSMAALACPEWAAPSHGPCEKRWMREEKMHWGHKFDAVGARR